MAKPKHKLGMGKTVGLILAGLVCFVLVNAALLHGTNLALFSPQGYIAGEEHRLMLYTVFILLDIGIPTLILFYFVAWKYRETNKKAEHTPNESSGKSLVFLTWAIPFAIMGLLAAVMWPATHRLAPRQALISDVKPMTIEVIAMRWKWLFIYPEQNIAAVNFVQIPTDTPVQFVLTADETPMSSFWIPKLGGQLYAMTGHQNLLNLMATSPGDYPGRTAEINGSGFAGMTFTARASTTDDFNSWVQDTRLASDVLDSSTYNKLLKPSENMPSTVYARTDPNLYNNLLVKYSGTHGGHAETATE
ncbi:MAG: cyoA [Candidatus Saccharibacteria bacterium]|nr:cyoA [Candidatus Saccharibacteria bacterium]